MTTAMEMEMEMETKTKPVVETTTRKASHPPP